MNRRQRLKAATAALFTALIGCAWAVSSPGLSIERSIGLDWLFKMRGTMEPPHGIIIVGINGRTGSALNLPRAPHHWPRTVHAELVDRLVAANAATVVFDVDFSRTKPGDEDAVLARSIANADRVVLFERLAARTQHLSGGDHDHLQTVWIEHSEPPVEVLAEAASAIAPFALPKVGQSAIDFFAFKPSLGDAPTIPAVALQMKALPHYPQWLATLRKADARGVEDLPSSARELKGAQQLGRMMRTVRQMFARDTSLAQRVRSLIAKDYKGNTHQILDALAALYGGPDCYSINFYGPAGTIKTVPFERLLSEPSPHGLDLRDAVVFVGYSDLSDADQPDRHYSSFTGQDGVDLSGVEILATAFANLLTQRALAASNDALSAAAIIVFGALVGALAWLLPATLAVPAILLLAGVYTAAAELVFERMDLWLPLATPLLAQLPVALVVGQFGQYVAQRRSQKHFAQTIRHYVPDFLVRDIVEKQLPPLALHREVLGTCLATDMSGFAKLAESKSPKELARFMNDYFEALASTFRQSGVDVMEFRADMVMCSWLSSGSTEDGQRAIDAAIRTTDVINRFATERELASLTPRVGLDRGSLYIGHSGGGGRYAYSIVGNTANTAARLESLNKVLGTQILISSCLEQSAGSTLLRPLGRFLLVGKSEPIAVSEILRPEHNDLCMAFSQALVVFQNEDWPRAAALFEALSKSFPSDGPSRFYAMQSRIFAARPTTAVGGAIIRMQEK